MRLISASILTIASLGLLIVGFCWSITTYSFIRSAIHTHGTIISNDSHRSSGKNHGKTYRPTFSFLTNDKQKVTSQVSYSSSTFKYFKKGDTIDVLYNPSNVYNAKIDSWKTLWIGPIAIMVSGILVSVVTAIIWNKLRAAEQGAAANP